MWPSAARSPPPSASWVSSLHVNKSGIFLHLQHHRCITLHMEKPDGKLSSSSCSQGHHFMHTWDRVAAALLRRTSYMLMVQMMAWLQNATLTSTHTTARGEGVQSGTPGLWWESALDAVDANRRSQERLKPEELWRGGEPEPQSHSVLLVKPPSSASHDWGQQCVVQR